MPNSVIVHVGYPKAASTTLQKHLFSRHGDIQYFGNYPTNNVGMDSSLRDEYARYLSDRSLRAIYKEMLKRDKKHYNKMRIQELMEERIVRKIDVRRVPVMSHERFLSTLFWNGDIEEKALRLRELLPMARILIVVRNQRDIIASQYRNHPFDPGNLSKGKFMTFSEWLRAAIERDSEIGYMSSLKYSDVIEVYGELFGAENVGVLCADDLAANVKRFSKEASAFMSIDCEETVRILSGQHENLGVPSYLARLRRYGKTHKVIDWFDRRIPQNITVALLRYLEDRRDISVLSSSMECALRDYFSESNIRLEKYIGARVREYSYPI